MKFMHPLNTQAEVLPAKVVLCAQAPFVLGGIVRQKVGRPQRKQGRGSVEIDEGGVRVQKCPLA